MLNKNTSIVHSSFGGMAIIFIIFAMCIIFLADYDLLTMFLLFINLILAVFCALLFIITRTIQSITFQSQHNKNYYAPDGEKQGYGEQSTIDLQNRLENATLKQVHALIADLDEDMSTTHLAEKIEEHLGAKSVVKQKTKRKRTYSIFGITIHQTEETI